MIKLAARVNWQREDFCETHKYCRTPRSAHLSSMVPLLTVELARVAGHLMGYLAKKRMCTSGMHSLRTLVLQIVNRTSPKASYLINVSVVH